MLSQERWILSMYDKMFLTGCDDKTEWMLKWWLSNFKKYNSQKIPVCLANFGMSNEMLEWAEDQFDVIIHLTPHKNKGWFLKTQSMIEASKYSKKVCWLDTDCEILRPIGTIFNYSIENKLGMVEDKPWTKRRGEVWHNSGVVLIEGCPTILKEWKDAIATKPTVGDQEVLHSMIGGDHLKRRVYINDLPPYYNWLRLQLLDGDDTGKKKIVHWTGNKGKDVIRRYIDNGK